SVADGLGTELPAPMPKALDLHVAPEVSASPALSLFALPGDGSIRTRRIALLVANGIEGAELQALHEGLTRLGAVPRYVGPRLGGIETAEGDVIDVEVTLETSPSVLYDAVVVPAGKAGIGVLGNVGQAAEFLKDSYRHCKPIMAIGEGTDLLQN